MTRLEGRPIVCANCGGGLPGTLVKTEDDKDKYVHQETKYCDYHIWRQKTERNRIVIAKPRIHSPGEKEA